ncbi:MAG: hypothetical protein DRI56_00645 [Chloroflexota bacterium]|nr:MAG: hypothetical protein DRI56_00645 [Chloroflexota bacterium]
MNTLYDIAIIGAGPGGTTTASYLARAGVRVLLVDKAKFPRDKTCGDALSPNALKVLGDLGLLGAVKDFGFRLNGVRLVAPDGNEMVASIPQKAGLVDYLYIAPRYRLDNLLLQHAIDSGAEFKPGFKVSDIQVERDKVAIVGKNRKVTSSFTARMGVIATGANISLLKKTGLMSHSPKFAVAARAYFENLTNLDNLMEIRFDGVPIPGYGWIFPTSATSANVGAGFLKKSRNLPITARRVFDTFLAHGPVQERLGNSKRMGTVKSYPLHMGFSAARTFSDRLIVVGEAAGLVNPFTGEGIDYAMESGQIAAQVLNHQLGRGDFSSRALHAYDKKLRARFQSIFVWSTHMRGLYMNNWLLNPLIRAAGKESFVRKSFIEILLGYCNAGKALSPHIIYHVLRNF